MTRSEHIRMILVGVILPALVGLAGTIAVIMVLPELPDPIAIHWGITGEPDGFGPAWITAVLPLLAVVYAGFAFAVVRAGVREHGISVAQRGILAVGPYLAVVLAGIGAGSVLAQRGLEDAADAPSILPLLAGSLGAGLLAGVGAWFALPRHRRPVAADPSSAPAIALTDTERVVWMQRLEPGRTAGVLIIAGLALAITAGAAIIWASAPLVNLLVWVGIVALLALAVSSTLFWTIRIDENGFAARSALGAPNYQYPLSEIEGAAVADITPLRDFGGWGIRMAGGRRTGIVLRAGEAIEVTRTDGKTLVVTVDDALRGAALLNGLVARSRKRIG